MASVVDIETVTRAHNSGNSERVGANSHVNLRAQMWCDPIGGWAAQRARQLFLLEVPCSFSMIPVVSYSASVPNQRFGDKYSGRGARIARREERVYWAYMSDEQRREAGPASAKATAVRRSRGEGGCPARNMSANL